MRTRRANANQPYRVRKGLSRKVRFAKAVKYSAKNMADWLEKYEETRFTVTATKFSTSGRRSEAHVQRETDLWDERLSVTYKVIPYRRWHSLQSYRSFTVAALKTSVGECILVNNGECKDTSNYTAEQWKAKVLEVRALNEEHVYLRVAWLNRPEDLDIHDRGRFPKSVLIPSNQMDIIDARTFNGKIEVVYGDTGTIPAQNTNCYSWNSIYDFVTARKVLTSGNFSGQP